MRLRVLSGIQPSGLLHLGNYAGAIRQFLDLQGSHEMFIFIASFHALTSAPEPSALRARVRQVAIDYLAFGLDPDRSNIYRQHDVPEVTELAWLLSCVCPMGQMERAVSYKDKVAKGIPANVGLFTYPILQAADILAVDADLVPVGKDQVQHIQITRDLAASFNARFQSEVFKIPEARVVAEAAVLPGIDGEKMSKSYGNGIDPFEEDHALRERVMSITRETTAYQIIRAIAGADHPRTLALAERFRSEGIAPAREELFALLLEHFGPARARYAELMKNPGVVDEVLKRGGVAARERAAATLARARKAVGLGAGKRGT